jgi:nanoRNase/pAp phosphatase (c-di-AMP/oligoRNAs hydrolase)
MAAVDKGDSADFTMDEVLHPEGWVLLNFLMDARTGLGRFREFRISNYHLMMELIDYCKQHTIDEILALPDVKERVDLYFEQSALFHEQLKRVGELHGNLVVLDLRDEEIIHAGNRFVIYAMHPEANVSMHVIWGKQRRNTVFAVGKSIFNKTCPVNVGELMLEYGGGGHDAAGTCQVGNNTSENARLELIERLRD